MDIMESLPRAITRTGYQGMREHVRNAVDCREDRGLPPHPRNSLIDCPECLGAGELTRNDSPSNDPQCAYEVTCMACAGTGDLLDGTVDPLLQMALYRRQRQIARHTNHLPYAKAKYRYWRRLALAKGCGLSAMHMRATAQLCANEAERGVAAFRRAVAA